jgi:hypothetical protein
LLAEGGAESKFPGPIEEALMPSESTGCPLSTAATVAIVVAIIPQSADQKP